MYSAKQKVCADVLFFGPRPFCRSSLYMDSISEKLVGGRVESLCVGHRNAVGNLLGLKQKDARCRWNCMFVLKYIVVGKLRAFTFIRPFCITHVAILLGQTYPSTESYLFFSTYQISKCREMQSTHWRYKLRVVTYKKRHRARRVSNVSY